MKLISNILVLTSLFIAASCNSNNEAASTNTGSENSINALPGQNNVPSTITPVDNGSSSTAALNPEHGLPGHRCDIPVGAPLNSTPEAKPSPTISSSSSAPATAAPSISSPTKVNVPSITPQSNVNSVAGGKMNPTHGQPGHRCDIPVGAPLN